MTSMKSRVSAALAISLGVVLGYFNPANAVSVGFGSTTDINNCSDADPCVLTGASDPIYLSNPGFSIFWATFSGISNQTISWDMTAAVDMDVVISYNGPVGINLGGGHGVYNFTSGQSQTVDLAFGSVPLTLNLITRAGDDNGDVSNLFSTGGGTGFAFDIASGALGAPITTSGAGGGSGNGTGTGGGMGGNMSPVPVPAAGWLLLAALVGSGSRKA